METYQQMQQRHRDEFSKLNIGWAFSDKQFEEMLERFGITREEAPDKLYKIDGGGFILKEDSPKLDELLHRHSDEEREALKNPKWAKDAFRYELDNHEACINWTCDWDTLSCFGHLEYGEGKSASDYMDELGFTQEIKDAYYEAKREHMQYAEAQGYI